MSRIGPFTEEERKEMIKHQDRQNAWDERLERFKAAVHKFGFESSDCDEVEIFRKYNKQVMFEFSYPVYCPKLEIQKINITIERFQMKKTEGTVKLNVSLPQEDFEKRLLKILQLIELNH